GFSRLDARPGGLVGLGRDLVAGREKPERVVMHQLQKLEAFGREVARRDAVESREQYRREAQKDRPY
ncbi:MAG: hypothetical protein ACREVJ_11025, partial [Gammaproteobacteria bacterium]